MTLLLAATLLALPALAVVLWPLWRRRGRPGRPFPLPPDPRQPLLEERDTTYRALRELAFEHDAGHLSDADYAALRERAELRAAELLTALDALGAPEPEPAAPPPLPPTRRPWTRQPVTIALSALALLGFGGLLGWGVSHYAEPDRAPGGPGPGLLSTPMGDAGATPGALNAPRGPLTPEILDGMLRAARTSLAAGRYAEAIAAYQAVLTRAPTNVDALTHLGLLVALGGHADAALDTFARALAHDPNYPPALFYRGQVLYESKHDYAGAAQAWDQFLRVVPAGQDHDRVAALLKEARLRARGTTSK